MPQSDQKSVYHQLDIEDADDMHAKANIVVAILHPMKSNGLYINEVSILFCMDEKKVHSILSGHFEYVKISALQKLKAILCENIFLKLEGRS